MLINTVVTYPLLVILSIGKKSFDGMGRFIKKSGDTISRILRPAEESFDLAKKISTEIFVGKKKLFVIIDDTLIKKFFAQFMQGSGKFYDTKLGRRITAFKLVVGIISDGIHSIPIDCDYLFTNELVKQMSEAPPTKEEIAQKIVLLAQKLFPDVRLIVLADGLYSTKSFLQWCIQRKIEVEMRMHSNRVVVYKGERISIKELAQKKGICLVGRQQARTVSVKWHDLDLELTIELRIDKQDQESIVFLIATYKALPREHVAHYKSRWNVEKVIRTAKSYGLQDCYSTTLSVQKNHVAAVLLSYAIAQYEMKKYKLKTPEDALRRVKMKNENRKTNLFAYFNSVFSDA